MNSSAITPIFCKFKWIVMTEQENSSSPISLKRSDFLNNLNQISQERFYLFERKKEIRQYKSNKFLIFKIEEVKNKVDWYLKSLNHSFRDIFFS